MRLMSSLRASPSRRAKRSRTTAGAAGADQELARAIRTNGRVFLAAEVNQTARDTKTEPGLQGDRSTGGNKPATVETGLQIQVPLAIYI